MYYKKVIINSVEDLPKEKGWYFVHWKHHDERLHTQMGVQYYDETITGLWFGKDWLDFYLLPVEQPMYSKEFVEWLCWDSNYEAVLNTVDHSIKFQSPNEDRIPTNLKTLDELHTYWEINIKEK